MVYYFVGKREAEQLTGLSHETLKKLRLNGKLMEGADWVRQSSRSVLYNAPLLLDFLAEPSRSSRTSKGDRKLLSFTSIKPAKSKGSKS